MGQEVTNTYKIQQVHSCTETCHVAHTHIVKICKVVRIVHTAKKLVKK